jgi:putative ABC transport system ATP-binding protein
MVCYKLQNVSFSYVPGKKILHIPKLTIKKAEKLFIHGPSGSGKSTLLNLLAGVLGPNKGKIEVLGKPFEKMSLGSRDQFRGDHIGLVFQNFNLISYLSIRENIMLPWMASKYRRLKVDDIQKEVHHLADHLKLDSFLDQKASMLSIGQQQRVGVARALIGSPEIVIADEPTSSLDDQTTNQFLELLMEEQNRKKFTLVFVSHDGRLARHFDSNISLEQINLLRRSN